MLSLSLGPINSRVPYDDDDSDEENAHLDSRMADYAELEYFCQASQTVAAQSSQVKGGQQSSLGAKKINGKPTPTEDFIGIDNAEEHKLIEEEASITEVDRLREENKRLKKTLLDKF